MRSVQWSQSQSLPVRRCSHSEAPESRSSGAIRLERAAGRKALKVESADRGQTVIGMGFARAAGPLSNGAGGDGVGDGTVNGRIFWRGLRVGAG